MPRPRWSADPVQRAFFEAWIDEADMPDEIREERIEAFRTRWGTLERDAFKRALQEGDEDDRLCALFALGYFAPAGVEGLLVPFLHSPVRKERWASAIVLGEGRDERAFPFLLALLLEEMEYVPTQADQYMESIEADDWKRVLEINFISLFWEHMKDPTFASMFKQQQEHQSEYRWYTIHRLTITTLLGRWGDERAIPPLRQALEQCWQIEEQGRLPGGSSDLWHSLEDDLAYALGQLAASHPFDDLELPALGLQLARMYFVFGLLKINTRTFYGGDLLRLIWEEGIDKNRVVTTLRERFGLTEDESNGTIRLFQLWYRERAGMELKRRQAIVRRLINS
ncbi:MAG TPA: hypothetical protein VFU49_22125 [Ktedonobacteraceae bacterium]|nr:hypothetical protein [Ktedonobacteraceae bacterium]